MPNSTETAIRFARSRRRAAYLTTASIASFALTLLAAGIALLANIVPVPISTTQRISAGTLLFVMPIVTLVLGVVVEATGIALSRTKLPEPRRRQTVRWAPTSRDS
jgi:hypothetical protein